MPRTIKTAMFFVDATLKWSLKAPHLWRRECAGAYVGKISEVKEYSTVVAGVLLVLDMESPTADL